MPKRLSNRRQGNAIVELALGLPLLVLLTFGAIEVTNLNYLQQCAADVSYQGALMGMRAGLQTTQVESKMNELLDTLGIEGGTVSIHAIDGASFDDLVTGDHFEVRTIIPVSNLPLFGGFSTFDTIESARFAVKP